MGSVGPLAINATLYANMPYDNASTGVGTSAHLSGELLNTMMGVETTHVPYKGAVGPVHHRRAGLSRLRGTPEEFAAYIRAETSKWAKVVKASGARAN
jgi:tripartite-type tricarboxylate transporter receptor subunit TctC